MQDDITGARLLPNEPSGAARITTFQVTRSFLFMGLCFSLNHGCVTALLGLASANLGDELSGLQSGTLYICYVLAALTMSGALVSIFGSKWSLFVGVLLYCAYVSCFILSNIEAIKWPAAIIGAAIGGFAAGNLWTAQGAYFGETVKVYCKISNKDSKEVTSMLGSYFAFTYLFFEVGCKLLSSLLYLTNYGDSFVYVVFTILAVAATAGMSTITNMSSYLDEVETGDKKSGFTTEKVMGALNIVRTDKRMLYMWPSLMSFGVLSSFLNYYVNGTIVKESIGKNYIGYLGSVVAGTAAICSLGFGAVQKQYGKGVLLILGQVCFFSEAAFCLMFSNAQLGDYLPLFLLYAVHGVGRSTFESTMRATFADIWTDDLTPYAFANIIIANGGMTSICFFVFPHITKAPMCILGMFMSALGIFGYISARSLMMPKNSINNPDIE